MPLQVVQGAQLLCDKGAAPTVLAVTSQQKVMVTGMLAATIMDFGPANIPTFGVCSVPKPPIPCKPAVVAPWTPGATKVTISGLPALTASCQCQCAIGGQIKIMMPGQIKENIT